MQAGAASGLLDEPGMLEADVGEFPQQVVQPDDGAVVAGGAGVGTVGPEDVLGAAGRAPTGPDPHGRQAPRLGAVQQRPRTDRVGRPDEHEHVPGGRHGPHAGDRIRNIERHGRQGPLAHDHGVDELDGDVPGVLRPLRGDAPHRRRGGEPPGQGERG